MELASIGGLVVKVVSPVVTKLLSEQVSKKLNQTELEKALMVAIDAANAADYRAGSFILKHKSGDTDKPLRDFLEKVFKHSDTLEELQKLLKREGMINAAIVQKVFEQSATELKLELNFDRIAPWITTFTETFFEKTAALRFQVAKEDYFKQVADWFDDVKFAGVSVPGNEVDKAATLDRIFVMPDVLEESRRGGFEIAAMFDDRQSELFREQRYRSQLEPTGRRFSAAQLLKQARSKTVLLGAPGTGKTTLMSYFAVMLAQGEFEQLGTGELLPILIRMRDWARQPNVSLIEFARQYAETTLSVKALPKGFFEHWLEQGHALILLDGLDEVPEESQRHHLVQCIENFLGQYRNNRALITSRPAGYRRDFFKTSEFPHYELLVFDDAKIETFINHWYDSRIQDPAEADRRKESLRKAISTSDRLKLLVRNPLLLTIVALIHRHHNLPQRRHELYDAAVKTLLIEWDATGKELKPTEKLEYLKLDDLRRLMEQVAYWIHTQGSVDDAEGGSVIDRKLLVEQLGKFIKALKPEKRLRLDESENEAVRFLNFIQERTGLLNEQGQDCYAFVHKTFQEYLCAQEINYRERDQDFDKPEQYQPFVLNHIRQYLHDQHWREVLLLLIAQQPPRKAARAICTVLEANSPYEQWLHRDRPFAGVCLTENPKDLSTVDPELAQPILEFLVGLEISSDKKVGSNLREQARKVLENLDETAFAAQALSLLKQYEDQIHKEHLLDYQVALGERELVVSELLMVLENDDYGELYFDPASRLGKIGKFSDQIETVIQALTNRFRKDKYDFSAAFALSELGYKSAWVEEVLAEHENILAAHQEDEMKSIDYIYSQIALLKKEITTNLDASIEKIIDFCVYNVHGSVAGVAAVLEELDETAELVKKELSKRLPVATMDRKVGITKALRYLKGISEEDVIRELLAVLESSDSSYARTQAIYELGKMGSSSKTILQAIQRVLSEEHLKSKQRNYVEPFQAIIALENLDNGSDQVVQVLLNTLNNEKWRVRSRAVKALGKLGKTSDRVLPAVLEWLDRHQDSEYIGAGIDALWEIVEG